MQKTLIFYIIFVKHVFFTWKIDPHVDMGYKGTR